MSQLWTPQSYRRPKLDPQLEDSTARFNADVESRLRFNTPVCSEWNAELAKLDARLKLAKAVTDVEAAGPGLKPGFYHLVMIDPPNPITVNPLTGPDGEYVEPTSHMLEMLRRNDLQNARAALDRARAEQRSERERERDRERDEEDRLDELQQRWDAATRTQVLLSPDVPWTQNWSANSRREFAARRRRAA